MRNRGQSAGATPGAGAAEAEEAPFDINKLLEGLEEIANRKLSSPDEISEAMSIAQDFSQIVGETKEEKKQIFLKTDQAIRDGSENISVRLTGIFEAVFKGVPAIILDKRAENTPILYAALRKLEMLQAIFDASPERSFVRGQLLDLFSAKFGSASKKAASLVLYTQLFVNKG